MAWGRRTSSARFAFTRFIVSHGLSDMAEWMVFVVVLVDVHARAGKTATGIASLAMLAPYLLVSPYAGQLTLRLPAHRVRLGSFLLQFVGYSGAAVAIVAGVPVWIPVASSMVATAAITGLRPANAILLPSVVHSSRELTRANLWLHHMEGAGAVLAPIAAAVLMAIGGASLGIVGVAAVAGAALALAAGAVSAAAIPAAEPSAHPFREFRRGVRTVAERPGAKSVIVLVVAQWSIASVLDLVIVITAIDAIDLGDASAGVLTALFSAGALVSVAVGNLIARRARLAPAILTLVVLVIGCGALLGWQISAATMVIALPLLGTAHRLLTLIPRLLLQRSAPPESLGTIFSILESGAGLGLIIGSIGAQILIFVGGAQTAMWGLAAAFVALLVLSGPALRRADGLADVPVVSISLIRRTPVFGPLPSIELDLIARSAVERRTGRDEAIVRQGEVGDEYYVVAAGRFDVHVDDVYVRTLERGDAFGEVALLTDAPRTASVTSTSDGMLLSIEREPFLMAVTGSDAARLGADRAIAGLYMGAGTPNSAGVGPSATPIDR